MNKAVLLFSALPLLLALPAHAEESKKSNWEVTVTTTDNGEAPSVVKMTQCMGDDEVKTQARLGNSPGQEGDSSFEATQDGCSVKYAAKGTQATLEQKCTGGESTNVTASSEDNYFIIKTVQTDNTGITSTITMEGKRLGGC